MATSGSRLSFLDGLRGWGALAVLLYHIFVQAYPPTQVARDWFERIPLFNGLLAVQIFFILSGFSLSIGFLQTGDRRILERIMAGRYFRLAIPIFLAVLLTYISVQAGILRGLLADNTPNLLVVLRFSFFDVFFNNNDPLQTPIPPLWTMPAELGGSTMVIALLWLTGLRWWRYVAYGALLIFLLHKPSSADGQYAAFMVGMVFADLYRLSRDASVAIIARPATWLIAPALIAAAFHDAVAHAMLSGVIASLLAASMIFSPASRWFLSTTVSRWLGRISFPLYLTHALVFHSLIPALLILYPSPGCWEMAAIDTAAAACSILVAFLLQFIDRAGIAASHKVASALARRRPAPPATAEAA